MKKKILLLGIIAFCGLFSGIAFMSSNTDETFTDDVKKLYDVGVIGKEEIVEIKAEDKTTVSEFITWTAKACGLESAPVEYFEETDNLEWGFIISAKVNGLFGEGDFERLDQDMNAPIYRVEAIQIIDNALELIGVGSGKTEIEGLLNEADSKHITMSETMQALVCISALNAQKNENASEEETDAYQDFEKIMHQRLNSEESFCKKNYYEFTKPYTSETWKAYSSLNDTIRYENRTAHIGEQESKILYDLVKTMMEYTFSDTQCIVVYPDASDSIITVEYCEMFLEDPVEYNFRFKIYDTGDLMIEVKYFSDPTDHVKFRDPVDTGVYDEYALPFKASLNLLIVEDDLSNKLFDDVVFKIENDMRDSETYTVQGYDVEFCNVEGVWTYLLNSNEE